MSREWPHPITFAPKRRAPRRPEEGRQSGHPSACRGLVRMTQYCCSLALASGRRYTTAPTIKYSPAVPVAPPTRTSGTALMFLHAVPGLAAAIPEEACSAHQRRAARPRGGSRTPASGCVSRCASHLITMPCQLACNCRNASTRSRSISSLSTAVSWRSVLWHISLGSVVTRASNTERGGSRCAWSG